MRLPKLKTAEKEQQKPFEIIACFFLCHHWIADSETRILVEKKMSWGLLLYLHVYTSRIYNHLAWQVATQR